jgi:hypothetical protein
VADAQALCLFAERSSCWNYACMAIQPMTIHDVPENVCDELAARAALQGKSMQESLRSELERLAARPSMPPSRILRVQVRGISSRRRCEPELCVRLL